MKASTTINPRRNNNYNFPQNPILSHPLNSNNPMMNQMNNMNNFNNMSMNPNINPMTNINTFNNIGMNPNMNNMNNINNINNLNNMSMNPNMNQINNFFNTNSNNNMNNNINNNINNFNSQNNMMMSIQNLQMNQINQIPNNNQGNNTINNKLQCILCYNKVNKPKRCKFCSQLYCNDCIVKWLNLHDYCQNCKQKITENDIENVSLDEDMSNATKKLNMERIKKNVNKHKSMVFGNGNQIKNNIYNLLNNNEQGNVNPNICQIHGKPFEYYCFQCGQYYCSNCLVFFNQENNKHANHFILNINQMNDGKIKEIITEYKKLTETKSNIDNVIGLSNYKLRENYIKINQFESSLNIIKEEYLKKIDESYQDLDTLLNELKIQKEKIETSIGSIPNGFNNIVQSNDHVQGAIMSEELKKLNRIDPNLENNIKQMEEIQPKIFVDNYHSELLQIQIPYSGQYNEGLEIFKNTIKLIDNTRSILVIKYLQKKVFISFSIDINAPLNSVELPKYYCFVTIKNQNYGLEFNNLLNQNVSNDVVRVNSGRANLQQINSNEFDFDQLMFMCGNDKIIKMQIYVMKIYFKQ